MFSIDIIGLLLAFCFLLIAFFLHSKKIFEQKTRLFWPDSKEFTSEQKSFKILLASLNKIFLILSFLFLLGALLDPAIKKPLSPEQNRFFSPNFGIAIFFVLDQSGSMQQYVSPEIKEGQNLGLTKIELLKAVTKKFIEGDTSIGLKGRPNDLIGLVTFARSAEVLSPLSMNHQLILDKLSKLEVIKDRNWDGTAIGYAIYKTAHLIASAKSFFQKDNEPIKNAIMILVTDGLQDPNPLDQGNSYRNMDLEEAAAYAKSAGVKIYIVNVDPNFKAEKYLPNLKQMQKITEETGGKFFLVDSSKGLGDIYETIDRLEKSRLPNQELLEEKERFYPYFLVLGMLFFALFWGFNLTLLRAMP